MDSLVFRLKFNLRFVWFIARSRLVTRSASQPIAALFLPSSAYGLLLHKLPEPLARCVSYNFMMTSHVPHQVCVRIVDSSVLWMPIDVCDKRNENQLLYY